MIQYWNYKKEIYGSTLVPWDFFHVGSSKLCDRHLSPKIKQVEWHYRINLNTIADQISALLHVLVLGSPNFGREGWEILFNPKSNQGTVEHLCWAKKKTAFWGQIRVFDSSAIKCQFQIQGQLPSRTFPQVLPICTTAFQWQELNDDKKKKVCIIG